MPHALTSRQREYLEFLREYIKENESSPRLEEIADHFGVKSPTAHKTLKALMNRGYIIFGRTKKTGFFVRLIERAGTAEMVYEVPVVGNIDGFGMFMISQSWSIISRLSFRVLTLKMFQR